MELPGSQSTNPYAHYSTYTQVTEVFRVTLPNFTFGYTSNGLYDGVRSLTLTPAANPTLGWARAKSTDIGIDLYFLTDQRLKFTFQWYRKVTGDQLVLNPLSSVTGIPIAFLDNADAEVCEQGVSKGRSITDQSNGSRVLLKSAFSNIAANRNNLFSYPALENLLSFCCYLKQENC